LKKNLFPESEIKEIISSFYSDYRVIYFTEKIMTDASNLRNKYSLSFWDSLVISHAVSVKCEVLYSEDMQHNQIFDGKLKVVNPFL
jgi:predicted nucleic acid-binding protein